MLGSSSTTFSCSRLLRMSVVFLVIAGCEKVPDGARFELTRGPMPLGIFLTDQKLILPWIPLSSTGRYEWCFANLGFSGSSAQVLLEIVSSKAFDPRNAGGTVTLSVADSKGNAVYQSQGELRDSEDVTGLSNRWVSEYFHFSSGPGTDLRATYFGNPAIRASVSRFGRYCTVLKISEASTLPDAQARLVLQSGWK
jgi:hypothetical protein